MLFWFQLYERLMERLEIYHQTVEQVSKDVIVSAQQLAKEEQLCQRSAYMSAMETWCLHQLTALKAGIPAKYWSLFLLVSLTIRPTKLLS